MCPIQLLTHHFVYNFFIIIYMHSIIVYESLIFYGPNYDFFYYIDPCSKKDRGGRIHTLILGRLPSFIATLFSGFQIMIFYIH